MRWYLVVLICISLIISSAELLLMCLLAICMSSLKKGLSKPSAHFFHWIVSFWLSAVRAVYIFWILTPCWLYHLQIFSPIPIGCLFNLLMISFAVQKTFFHWIVSFLFSAVRAVYIFWILTPVGYHLQIFSPIPIGCLFILLMTSFAVQKPLIRCHLFIFTFISFALRDRSKKILLQFMSQRVLPMFFSSSSMASGFTFRSLIHFGFIQFFVYGVSKCPNLILLHVAVQFSQLSSFPTYWSDCLFSTVYSCFLWGLPRLLRG